MMVIFDVLFILSAILAVIVIIMMAIRLIFKKGISYKKGSVFIVSSIVVFIISGILMPDLTPEQKAQVEQRKLEKEQSKIEKQESKDKKEKEQQQEDKEDKVEPKKKENNAADSSKKDKPKKKDPESTAAINTTDDKKEDKSNKKSNDKEQTVVEKSRKTVYDIFEFADDPIDETITDIEFDKSNKSLSVTVKGKDGWSEKSMGAGFYEDSTSVYRELAKDERIDEVWLTIVFPMKDEYGKVNDEEVMATWMSRETMNKIDWKKFNYLNLLDVVDGKTIYPQFVQ